MSKRSAADALTDLVVDVRERLADIDALIEDCPLRGKWRGCNFEPRYDKSAVDFSPLTVFPEDERADIKDSMKSDHFKTHTYVCDVCTRCGRTNNPPTAATEDEAESS